MKKVIFSIFALVFVVSAVGVPQGQALVPHDDFCAKLKKKLDAIAETILSCTNHAPGTPAGEVTCYDNEEYRKLKRLYQRQCLLMTEQDMTNDVLRNIYGMLKDWSEEDLER